MDIQSISDSRFIDSTDSEAEAQSPVDETSDSSSGVNSGEISEAVRMMALLKEVGQGNGIREERIQRLSTLIQSGEYETQERLDELAEQLVDELI